MKSLKSRTAAVMLAITISSTTFAGTIVGARTSRTGTIVGARTGNIVGARTGNITGARTGISDTDLSKTKLNFETLLSENIFAIIRLFADGPLF